jgi:hypothetical protein
MAISPDGESSTALHPARLANSAIAVQRKSNLPVTLMGVTAASKRGMVSEVASG